MQGARWRERGGGREGEREREGKITRRIVAAARLLQRLRKVHPVVRRREESRDSAVSSTPILPRLSPAMRTDGTGLKPSTFSPAIIAFYPAADRSIGRSNERTFTRRAAKGHEIKRLMRPADRVRTTASITPASLLQ